MSTHYRRECSNQGGARWNPARSPNDRGAPWPPARHVGRRGSGVGHARRICRRPRRAGGGADARAHASRAGRARAGAGMRSGRAGPGSRGPSGSRGRGGALRRGRRDDGDRRGARRRARVDERSARASSTSRASRNPTKLRRRALPRGTDVRDRPRARRPRDPAGAAAGRTGRARGLGTARAQPLAGTRLRRRERPDRAAGAAPGHPGAVLARRRRTADGAARRRRTGGRRRRRAPRPLRAASFEDWWERTSALAGPLAKILASLPGPAAMRCARLREATAAYATPAGLEFPGVSLIAAARRP